MSLADQCRKFVLCCLGPGSGAGAGCDVIVAPTRYAPLSQLDKYYLQFCERLAGWASCASPVKRRRSLPRAVARNSRLSRR